MLSYEESEITFKGDGLMVSNTIRRTVRAGLAGVGVSIACVGLAATSAQAVTSLSPAANTAKPSAAEIEANNAAARASLPPNVTMTVIGKLPKLDGPTDHYYQNGPTVTSGATPLAAATVPYNFTFSGVWSLYGRTFRLTESSTVCKDVQATWDGGYRDQYHYFYISLRDSSVTVPADGVARSWCWSGIPTYTDLQFYYGVANESGGNWARVSGSGRVRYSWQ